MYKKISKLVFPVVLALLVCGLSACGEDDNTDMLTTAQGNESTSIMESSTAAEGTTTTGEGTTTAPGGNAGQSSMQSQNGGAGQDGANSNAQVGESRNYGSYYVYYANKDRSGLLRDEVEYTKDYAEDFGGRVRESLGELFSRSEDDYMPLASDDKNIRSISLDQQGTLVIDFDKEFVTSLNDMEMPDNVTIYGLVNTLAQYSEIRSVRFTVEGEPITLNDVTYSDPFTEDNDMVMDNQQ